ncbi:MAG TPA: DUF4097 family beta strand repeat-containing protein [Gemmatimonadaceae bacterium]|nr:DUF4097 family beta strand repeat-containing protein [Gemmatimonadaceae bacterium]
MQRLLTAALAATMAMVPLCARAQGTSNDGNTFDWAGNIPTGSWLRIRNLNGGIDVEEATGDRAEVHGEKQWRHGDPQEVRFAVTKDGNDVTVCALWSEDDTCDAEGYHSHGHHENHSDVSVHFTVRLPKGVKVDLGTVNGSLDVRGAGAEVVAETVNGRIDAATSHGPVTAHTVNGSIRVRMDELPAEGDLSYSTVNGSVTAELPAALDAEVEMETVNGSLSSDFPLSVSGRVTPKHLRATIGHGGRRLRLQTVNGSVELRKLS